MSTSPLFSLHNRYAQLPDEFYAQVNPSPVLNPTLIQFNQSLATQLGAPETLPDAQQLAQLFSGNTLLENSKPLAMAYSGHQFGNLNPHLGDGRAILLGNANHSNGLNYDIQLKGSGRTPFSRNGDGRAALGPVLREYLLSESMHVLGVPTTRALAAVSSGEMVMRERMLPGAIITRAATGFVRVGTFQYFAIRGNHEAVKTLADYVIQQNYPELQHEEQPYLALLNTVIERQAQLIARWMQLGFIHGVMNTDNMSISGETIDYGPCAFMDEYHPETVFSSIDRQGRYAYQNQPAAGHWDLCRLAESLAPLFAEDTEHASHLAQKAINHFPARYDHYWLTGMAEKLGLEAVQDSDRDLINNLLNCMAGNQADFTLTFYHLSDLAADSTTQDQQVRELFERPAEFDHWAQQWRHRLTSQTCNDHQRMQAMHQVNPLYIPRNHQVEAVIRAAEDQQDFQPFYRLLEVLHKPYTYQANCEQYATPPKPEERVLRTFCGT